MNHTPAILDAPALMYSTHRMLVVWIIVANFYHQHCAQHNTPVFKLPEADFEVFRPTGDTLHRWG